MGKLEQATHSFGHHTVSGLCSLIPDLYWECHQIPMWHVTIDLLAEEPLPAQLRESKELRDITSKLREKFFSILAKHSPNLGKGVSKLQISVEFSTASPEELRHLKNVGSYHFHAPPYTCKISTVGPEGRHYEAVFADAT